MWPSEKQENVPSSPNAKQESTDAIVAYVGKGVTFTGTVSYSGTVRIDGIVDGEIQTDGTVLVGADAVITATVRAGTLVCMGTITGDVTAQERIQLLAPAVLTGGVKTPKLSIEDGVRFNGTIEMTQAVRAVTRDTSRRSIEDHSASPLRRATA